MLGLDVGAIADVLHEMADGAGDFFVFVYGEGEDGLRGEGVSFCVFLGLGWVGCMEMGMSVEGREGGIEGEGKDVMYGGLEAV